MKYIIRVAIVLIILAGVVWVSKPSPCYDSLDLYPSFPNGNYGQRILTAHNCSPGEVPVNIHDFDPQKPLQN